METLDERITDGQAEDFAATLPDVAADPLREAHPREAEEFSLAAFVVRVTKRTDATDDAGGPIEPVDLIRAVLTGVGTAADDAELERTRDQLPAEFDAVFEPGRLLDDEEFHETVAERLLDGVDADSRTATDATLRTLADRITGGQAGASHCISRGTSDGRSSTRTRTSASSAGRGFSSKSRRGPTSRRATRPT